MSFLSSVGNFLLDPFKRNISSVATPLLVGGAYIGNKLSETSTGKKVSSAQNTYQGITESALKNVLNAYQTSAIKEERQATLQAQEFQKQQADLAWQRSESSAQKQMDFQREQADLAWQRSETSAQKQMDFQREMWQKSADYNTEMSNTAYQRAVADLRKSGLNPILAVTNGSASAPTMSIPSGASSSAQAMSGASASAQAMSGFKSDYSSAKNSDLKGIENILGLFSSAFTSALKLLR